MSVGATVSPAEYGALVASIRQTVRQSLPADAVVLVVSRGDGALLELNGRTGLHFPQDPDGQYSGYHPESSQAAITHLEELRAGGADHLLLPRTDLWWLDHYTDFADHLDSRYRKLDAGSDACVLYSLRGAATDESGQPDPTASTMGSEAARAIEPLRDFLGRLLPRGAIFATVSLGHGDLLRVEGRQGWHFPRDGSGEWTGHAVGDAQTAMAQLEALRAAGVGFLVLPRFTRPWLEGCQGLEELLERRWRRVADQHYLGTVFDLTRPNEPTPSDESREQAEAEPRTPASGSAPPAGARRLAHRIGAALRGKR
jgi:hypothetical protein